VVVGHLPAGIGRRDGVDLPGEEPGHDETAAGGDALAERAASRTRMSASRFATTRSKRASMSSAVPASSSTCAAPFRARFSRAIGSTWGSSSMATTRGTPSRRQRESQDAGAGADVERARDAAAADRALDRREQPRVVACWPVPKAIPGSMISTSRPGASGTSQGGATEEPAADRHRPVMPLGDRRPVERRDGRRLDRRGPRGGVQGGEPREVSREAVRDARTIGVRNRSLEAHAPGRTGAVVPRRVLVRPPRRGSSRPPPPAPHRPRRRARTRPSFATPFVIPPGIDVDDDARNARRRAAAVIAHRGASGTCPENTMAAFRRALEVGAHMIELDVQLDARRRGRRAARRTARAHDDGPRGRSAR
jgi:hypothetical protein